LLAIVLVFVVSLGNRPQGSKTIYLCCFALFATIMGIMLYVVGSSLYHTLSKLSWADATNILQSPTVYSTLLSVAATYGIYFLSSLLYFEPWHMITSFLQYMLFLPSFTNILMVYACEYLGFPAGGSIYYLNLL
jgi:chitin synthase